jgi:hypothetical protein
MILEASTFGGVGEGFPVWGYESDLRCIGVLRRICRYINIGDIRLSTN